MPELTLQQAFELALSHHQAGRLAEAEPIYRQILAVAPQQPETLHCLGVLAQHVGQSAAAIELIGQALAIRPTWPAALSNLGVAFNANGQPDQAIAVFRQALALQPDMADTYNNLGNALNNHGQLDEAVAAYRQAIVLKPDFAAAYSNLGNALINQGQLDESIAVCGQAIALKPDYTEAYINLGNALNNQGQLDQAVAAYRHAIVLQPDFADTYKNLGNALFNQGQLDQAIAAYRQVIALRPNDAEAHCNLGNVLNTRSHLDQAVAAYRQALILKPDYADAHCNLGIALNKQGRLDESIRAYRQALVLKPDFAEAHSNLSKSLVSKGQLDEAVAACREAIRLNPEYPEPWINLCNAWKDKGQLDEAIVAYRQANVLKPTETVFQSNFLLMLHYHPEFAAPTIAAEHQQWNRQVAEPLRHLIQPHHNDRLPERRLRIGYVSPDLREHSVGHFLLPLLEHHDRDQYEIFAYAEVENPDALTERLRANTAAWRSTVGLSDDQVAELIRADQIDILVDLAMHTAYNRLLVFARKPAPVQVNYLAYVGSSGLTTMDYRLSDPYLDPLDMDESIYSEQTIRLPETYWCYQSQGATLLPAAASGIKKYPIRFGCLNNFCKINDPLLDLWSKILQAVPHARLLLHAQPGDHRQRTLDRFARQGIAAGRVDFVGKQARLAYFQTYQSLDITLDTTPYAGGTTTCDSLWMGVPVVTLAGERAVGRGGVSILTNVGLPELIAQTPEQYIEIAVELAHDLPRLRELRATMRPRMQASPLMDAAKFARNVEAAYRQMWRTWCEEASR